MQETVPENAIAIVTVYMIDDSSRRLFDYHLARIREHTKLPFRIFATAEKTYGAHRRHIEAQPDIEIVPVDLPPFHGVRNEHTFCLETCAAVARARGYGRFVSLHLDSFPISDRWADVFETEMAEGPAVASIVPNGYSAGLFWNRAFYDDFAPAMLVPEQERASPSFERFTSGFPQYDHVETGIGYFYTALKEDLPWHRLETDAERKIYGNLMFHMVAATVGTRSEALKFKPGLWPKLAWKLLYPLRKTLPPRYIGKLREPLVETRTHFRDNYGEMKRAELKSFTDDPDAFVRACLERSRAGTAAPRDP